MNICELFIRRPIMTTLVMLTILLFGIVSYLGLPVSDLPNVDYPTIQVSASLSGANPDTMASAVATPLEKEFSTIAGVDSMSSSSALGSTQITLQFVLSRSIDAAAQDVQAAIARAMRKLPVNMTTPPSYRKVNPADQPILWLTLTSLTQPMYELDEVGQTTMAQRISMIDGVAQVMVFGSQKYAVRIELDPRALSAKGIGLDEVADAINQQNVNLPLGSFDGRDKSFTIEANGQLLDPVDVRHSAGRFAPAIVAYRNGRPVRLREIGVATDDVENNKAAAWYTREGERNRSIILAIQRQPGTNTVAVADKIKDLLPKFRADLPASITLDVLRDSSLPIRASAEDVQFTLYLTLVLVVLVIFLFLRNVSATIIPSLTLPMAIVGTFLVMAVLNYSLDNLSLMALTLSVGFVVDDAIVMLENIVRHMEMGKTRMQAALDGAKEIGFTIVSMTLSLAAVFIPVLFMSGLVGRLFREFSITIGAAVLVSGFVSLTLTPMLASRFLKDPTKVRHGLAYRATEAVFQGMLKVYEVTLRVVLRHPLPTMAFSVLILVATGYLFIKVPKGFIPTEDRDQISVSTEAAQDISFEAMAAHQNRLADIVRDDPDVDRFMSRAGGNGGGMFLVLKPRDRGLVGRVIDAIGERRWSALTRPADGRKASADEVVARLRTKCAAVPGIKTFLTIPPAINMGGRSSKSLYQLTLQGTNTEELYRYAGELEQKIRELPLAQESPGGAGGSGGSTGSGGPRGPRDAAASATLVQDVTTDMQLANLQVNLEIDRDQAFIKGVSPMQIENALCYAYGASQVSTLYAPNNQYQVIMELQPQFQTDPSLLSMLYVRSSHGQLVPLNSLARQSDGIGPLQINHTGQLPSVTISFNLAPGVSIGQAVDRINAITLATMPGSMSASFQGTAQAFQSSLQSMIWLLCLAIIVIYVVLGILYESFYHPITILSALPFAGFGALLTLVLFNCELSIYAFVGIIMLVGLVKKNGIMMVDFALGAQRTGGKSARDAIFEACLVRFRPIMMTTVAALMAGLPIAAGYGAGGEARRPLGLAVVGGLLFSQTLTLYVTPVFFIVMDWIIRLIHGQAAIAATAPAAGLELEVPPPLPERPWPQPVK